MKRIVLAGIAALALVLAACSGSSSSGTSSSGKVTLQFWTAQTPPTTTVINNLAATFNATHPNIVVQASSGGTSTGDLLPKVTTAIAAGTAPDVAYIYGSYAANIAQSGKTVNLANIIHTPGYDWNDFYPASQQTVSPGGKVIGFPALIDNLSVIYNKKLFAAAGVPDPSPNWTWDQFRAVAKKLTNPAKHIFGVNYPIGGDLLDTSWRFFPGLWQRGGQILSAEPQAGAVQLVGGRSEPDALAADGDRRPFGVPGPDGERTPNRCSRAGIWRCSSAARGRSRCSTRRRSTGRTCRCRP